MKRGIVNESRVVITRIRTTMTYGANAIYRSKRRWCGSKRVRVWYRGRWWCGRGWRIMIRNMEKRRGCRLLMESYREWDRCVLREGGDRFGLAKGELVLDKPNMA